MEYEHSLIYICYTTTFVLVLEHSMLYMLINTIAFLQIYNYLKIPVASTKYDMLELSPMSTQCTHGAAVKLFCRYMI